MSIDVPNSPANRTAQPDRSRSRSLVLAAACLSTAIGCAGLLILTAHAAIPGNSGTGQPWWPSGTPLGEMHGKPKLVIAIHPECPCTRASLRQLASVLATGRDRCDAIALVRSDAANDLSPIPGLRIVPDPGGRLAAKLGQFTSGDVVFYGTDGKRLFHGGITDSRGHEGRCSGSQALSQLLIGEACTTTTAPVFGCVIQDGVPQP